MCKQDTFVFMQIHYALQRILSSIKMLFKYGDSLKKVGIKLPYDPTIPLSGIYPEKP